MEATEPQFHLLVNALIARNAARAATKLDATPGFPLTRYALAKALKGKVAQRSVYDFLEGKPVRTNTLFAILTVCKIEVRVFFESWHSRYSFSERSTKEQLLEVIGKLIANENARSLDNVISLVVNQTPKQPPRVPNKPFMRMVSDLDAFPDDEQTKTPPA